MRLLLLALDCFNNDAYTTVFFVFTYLIHLLTPTSD